MIDARHRWVFPDPLRLDPEFRAAARAAGRRDVRGDRAGPPRDRGRPARWPRSSARPIAGLNDPRLLPDADALLARVARARAAGRARHGLRGLRRGRPDRPRPAGDRVPPPGDRRDAVRPVAARRGARPVARGRRRRRGGRDHADRDRGHGLHQRRGDRRGRRARDRRDRHGPPPPARRCCRRPSRSSTRTARTPPTRTRSCRGSGVAFTVARLLLGELAGAEADALDLADLATIGTVVGRGADPGREPGDRPARPGADAHGAAPGDRRAAGARPGRSGIGGPRDRRLRARPAPQRRRTGGGGARRRPPAARGDAGGGRRPRRDPRGRQRDPPGPDALGDRRGAVGARAAGPGRRPRPGGARARDRRGGRPGHRRRRRRRPGRARSTGPGPSGSSASSPGASRTRPGGPRSIGTPIGDVIRASCRSDGRLDLAEIARPHAATCSSASAATRPRPASSCRRTAGRRSRSGSSPWSRPAAPVDPRTPLAVDLALPAAYVDYALYRDLARLAPCGPGNPEPLVAVLGLTVQRVRAASGGHTQLVLRRERDVLDGIAFGRPDLAAGARGGRPRGRRRPARQPRVRRPRDAPARGPRRGPVRLAIREPGRSWSAPPGWPACPSGPAVAVAVPGGIA